MSMDERRIADYFVVAGLPEDPEPLDDTTLSEGGNLKASHGQAPITDISVIFPSLGEEKPDDYEIITKTPTGLIADLNHGSLRTMECYLCIRRGRDKPPLVDIGVMYEGKEYLMNDAEVVSESVGGHVANVNNSTSQTFITYRRAEPTMPCNALVVTDVCVVIASKGESPPHAFCCISKNLNKGIVGSDVFLCYKKSMNRAKLLTYKPAVLCRYPMTDMSDFPFPHSVPLFCLPMGSTLELWPKQATRPRPVCSTFVLTVSDAKHKVYGSSITFYEKFPVKKLTDEQRELLGYEDDSDFELNVNKSICVLSHWPFSDDFQIFLLYLHLMASSGRPQPVPIEKYITQLLDEVPFPSPRVLLQLSPHTSEKVILTQPEDLPLPRNGASFKQLLLNLGSENCLQVLLLALTEQKILIHSLRPDTLTAVAEALTSLLFPFKWQCPYIPLCPLGLVEVLHAPLPFLIGVDSRFFDLYDPPPDVSCIDLDTNIITVAESQRHNLNVKLLPKRPAKLLKYTLDYIHQNLRKQTMNTQDVAKQDNIELEFQRRRKEQAQELQIQEAFLKFMVQILKGYRLYLLPITKAPTVGTTDPQALFNLNEFLKSRDKVHVKFFSMVMKTQMFIRFIEESSFVMDGDQGLAFFDECMEKLNNEEGDFRLIELDSVQKSDRTVFVLPPEPSSSCDVYEYTQFELNPALLNSRRKSHLSNIMNQCVTPGSPMARRTKHEIKSAQKLAKKYMRSPDLWARCLSGACHTLYFMVLPSLLSLNGGKETVILQQAYELLVRATTQQLACDEVCYRLMMQLCGEHNRPLLAVKLLVLMKKYGMQPNALTHGLYNRCVLEAEWPAYSGSSQLWKKLRNVVMGAAHFKFAAKRRSKTLSASTEGATSLLDQTDRTASRSSLDSHEAVQENSFLNRFKKMAGSIVRGSLNGLEKTVVDGGEIQENECDNSSNEGNNQANGDYVKPDSPSEYRVLSRSESAGDANIIDKIQNNNRKMCSRNLQFDEVEKENKENEQNGKNSPSKVSPREVVTENDPLGALEQPIEVPQTNSKPEVERNNVAPQNPLLTDEPRLFRSSVHRSATFEGSPPAQSKLHRSETVPAETVASSLANLGSSFKLSFSRYTSTRLSLRKADLKVPHLIIETAINSISPNSFAGKKSNELIQGGISSIKSVASSMVKKMEEIKEAVTSSANSTPVKLLPSADRLACGDVAQEDSESCEGSESGERHRRVSAELGSYRGSFTNLKDYEEPLPENQYPISEEETPECEIDIAMTTCSQCHNCSCLLYDEDIMSNWSAEDSNLNTLCMSCNKPTVPFLTVTIQGIDPFSVPYLNPLVLRKELETVLTQEGDLSLSKSNFIDKHPIIYWNLVWVFERINVETHLPNLYLKNRKESGSDNKKESNENVSTDETEESNSSMKLVEEGTDPLTQELATIEQMTAQVNVRCLWDDPKFHSEGPPMYVLWRSRDMPKNNNRITKSFMQQIINYIRVNDLVEPLKSLANERNSNPHISNSTYRDILFLACKALGRAQIDINEFDKEYTNAYSRVSERLNKLGPQDRPISLSSLYCRQYFRPLTLP